MTETLQLVLAFFGGIGVVGVGLGAIWKIVKPWMREQLVQPMNDVHHQVTANAHVSTDPTMLDRFDDLESSIDGVDAKVDRLSGTFDRHLIWSDEEVSRLWAHVTRDP